MSTDLTSLAWLENNWSHYHLLTALEEVAFISTELTLLQSEKNRIQPVRYSSFSNRQTVEQDARARDYFFSYQRYRAFLFP